MNTYKTKGNHNHTTGSGKTLTPMNTYKTKGNHNYTADKELQRDSINI